MAKSLKKRPSRRAEIIDLLCKGYSNAEIVKKLKIKLPAIYYVKKKYNNEITLPQPIVKVDDISNYEEDVTTILKRNVMDIGNTIANSDKQKASLSQLTTSMAIMVDKIRLLEGKSTANISTNIVNNLDDRQLRIVKESIKSLKKSMLNKE